MVWDGIIACYLFLAGLGAGAFVLGALAGWAKTAAPTMKKIAFIVAPVAVAVGTLLLVVDAKAGFGNPMRFFLLISNLSSVMSWGVIILSVFLVVSFIELVLMLVKKSTPKALDIAGIVCAVCVAAYTGVLLGDAHIAFPLWNMAVLPVLFLVSAASAGIAATVLICRFVAPNEVGNVAFLPKAGLALPVLELVLVVALIALTAGVSGSAADAAQASVANLISGPYAAAFWLGLIIVGLVVPFGIELASHKRASAEGTAAASGKGLAVCGEACVLVGGFMLRYLVVMAAMPVVFA